MDFRLSTFYLYANSVFCWGSFWTGSLQWRRGQRVNQLRLLDHRRCLIALTSKKGSCFLVLWGCVARSHGCQKSWDFTIPQARVILGCLWFKEARLAEYPFDSLQTSSEWGQHHDTRVDTSESAFLLPCAFHLVMEPTLTLPVEGGPESQCCLCLPKVAPAATANTRGCDRVVIKKTFIDVEEDLTPTGLPATYNSESCLGVYFKLLWMNHGSGKCQAVFLQVMSCGKRYSYLFVFLMRINDYYRQFHGLLHSIQKAFIMASSSQNVFSLTFSPFEVQGFRHLVTLDSPDESCSGGQIWTDVSLVLDRLVTKQKVVPLDVCPIKMEWWLALLWRGLLRPSLRQVLRDFLCTRPTASQLTPGQPPCIWGCHSDSTRDSETLRTAFLNFGFLQLVVVSLFERCWILALRSFMVHLNISWCYKVVHKQDNPHLSSLSKKDPWQGENGCGKDSPVECRIPVWTWKPGFVGVNSWAQVKRRMPALSAKNAQSHILCRGKWHVSFFLFQKEAK